MHRYSWHGDSGGIADRLAEAGEQAPRKTAWKAIVKTYLSLEYSDDVEYGCPFDGSGARAGECQKPPVAELFDFQIGRQGICMVRSQSI